ncbi:MAG: ATP-dependent zinc metalloprotease FtsH [Pseudomonadota bacterium]|nr:ATP-dependent zinc metalloprotease FtsH [Pseudomonadota bacterium]
MFFVAVLVVFFAINTMVKQQQTSTSITYSEFIDAVKDPSNRVREVSFKGSEIRGTLEDNSKFRVYGPKPDAELRALLEEHGVLISFEPPEQFSWWKSILINWLPMLVLLFLFFFFMRQLQVGGGKAMSFGKSRAKLLGENKVKVTFKDVAGVEEAKEELGEVVDFLRDPKKFSKLGGRIPRGMLLVGPPGTGKTLLAKAVAGEADAPFFFISGSEFVEMFVGVGASRVRDLFEQAKKNAPCIVFIDEIDAVGRHRGAGLGGGHDEREQTLNQLLVEMDGFESNSGVIIVAATNRPDVLDPALLRPGRFDRQVIVDKPDIKGRTGILKVHSRKTPMADDVRLEVIAQGTPGFSGADLQNLVNEASLLAARADQEIVSMAHFEHAKDKIMMGPERRSMVMPESEKRNTSYHEAGHALVGLKLKNHDPLHKISIIPRGRALGVTILLPADERYSITREYAEGMIAYAMGGRAAEEIVFSRRTTGAGDDIQKATDIARKMVCNWGMSDAVGPLAVGKQSSEVFLGREISQQDTHSEKMSQVIDDEIQRLLKEGYDRAYKMLADNREQLESIAQALLIKETLTAEEVELAMQGKDIVTAAEREVYQQRLLKDKQKQSETPSASSAATATDKSNKASPPYTNLDANLEYES